METTLENFNKQIIESTANIFFVVNVVLLSNDNDLIDLLNVK